MELNGVLDPLLIAFGILSGVVFTLGIVCIVVIAVEDWLIKRRVCKRMGKCKYDKWWI